MCFAAPLANDYPLLADALEIPHTDLSGCGLGSTCDNHFDSDIR